MPHSHVELFVHIIFSTKRRRPFLKGDELRRRTHGYLAGICRKLGCSSEKVGGVADHVHILCRLSPKVACAELLCELKRDSSKWIKRQCHELAGFAWQEGYAAFSVSPSHFEALRRYIENQEEHHLRETFQDELRRILEKYGIVETVQN